MANIMEIDVNQYQSNHQRVSLQRRFGDSAVALGTIRNSIERWRSVNDDDELNKSFDKVDDDDF